MKQSIPASKKSRRPRGRPKTTGTGEQINMRWHADDLSAIDGWGRSRGLDRTEAIRELVRLGLRAEAKKRGSV